MTGENDRNGRKMERRMCRSAENLLQRVMISIRIRPMNVKILITFLAIAAILALAYWRFGGGRYGRLQPSSEVTHSFESFRLDPEKSYYASGPDHYPNAIIGIDKSWRLESDLWKKLDPTEEGIRRLVENMHARARERMAFLHGFDILDENGGKIGDWYSIQGLNIMIRTAEENRVVITTPPLEIYPNR